MTKTRHDSETLAEGTQVFTACALICKHEDGVPKVLLCRRAKTKKFLPGVYELPGGHVDYGEELHDGLRRELREELGVEIGIGDVAGVFTYMNHVKKCQSIEVVYFASLLSSESDIALHPEDHSEYVWVSEAELQATVQKGGKDETDNEYILVKNAFTHIPQTDI
jgi:8-oxo-dGTP diphosphatase